MKLSKLLKEFANQPVVQKDPESRQRFLEAIGQYNTIGTSLERKGSLQKIAEMINQISEQAQNMTVTEAGDWFDQKTVSNNMAQLKKASAEFRKIAEESSVLDQRMTALYEDIGHILGRYYDIKEAELPIEAPAKAAPVAKPAPTAPQVAEDSDPRAMSLSRIAQRSK